MKSGRKRFQERLGIFLNVEKSTHELARYAKLPDTEAYTKGVMDWALEHPEDLTEQHLHTVIQHMRVQLQALQDRIAHAERVALDLRIKAESQQKKKVETRYDELGQAYLAVEAP
jgi:hypothetical protein